MNIYIIVLFFLGIFFLLWTIFILFSKIKSRKDKILLLVPILGGFIFLIFSTILPYILPQQIPLDYIELNRPRLFAKLIIEKIEKDNILIGYQLTNNGLITAKNIRYYKANSGDLYIELLSPERRDLGNMETINLISGLGNYPIQKHSLSLRVDLVIFYEAIIAGIEKNYKTMFRFFILEHNIKIGEFEPALITREEDILDKSMAKELMKNANLESDEGSLSIVFYETNQHPSLNSVLVESKSKFIFYNPREKSVVFRRKAFGMEKNLTRNINPNIDFHIVIITWTKTSAHLYVDGHKNAHNDTIIVGKKDTN